MFFFFNFKFFIFLWFSNLFVGFSVWKFFDFVFLSVHFVQNCVTGVDHVPFFTKEKKKFSNCYNYTSWFVVLGLHGRRQSVILEATVFSLLPDWLNVHNYIKFICRISKAVVGSQCTCLMPESVTKCQFTLLVAHIKSANFCRSMMRWGT